MIDSLRGCLHLLCLGFAVAVAARDDFAVGPSNQAVVAGRRMEMECRAKNGSKILKWSLTRTKSTQKEWVCRRGPPIMSYRNFSCAVNEQESVTLFKNSTNPRDAGIYFCYNSPEQKQFKAHLIVFESEPVCEVNQTSSRGENATLATGDEVSVRCRVNFHGQWTPSVEWWKHTAGAEGGGGGGGGGGGKVVAGRESSTSVSSSSSSEANLLSSSLHVVVAFDLPTYFVFRLFFVWRDDLYPVNASNVPEFRYEWRSPVMFPEQPRIEQVVQVVVETVTSKDNPTGDWYLVSLILLVVVPVIVFSIAVVVIRWCYIGYRRNKGLDQRSMPAKPAFLHGLERPASGEYDVIPYAAPNIYDRIEDGEPIEKSTDAQQQQQQQHPPLTQCYSQLSDTTLLPPDPYDALTPYLSMESTPNTPGHCPLPQVPLSERYENRYTEVANRGNMAATTKDNYLTLVGEDEADARETSTSDDDGVSDEDASMSRFAKANGDYLIPFV